MGTFFFFHFDDFFIEIEEEFKFRKERRKIAVGSQNINRNGYFLSLNYPLPFWFFPNS